MQAVPMMTMMMALIAGQAVGQVEITSFHGNGVITWTNSARMSLCHLEWAPNLTSGWSRSYANLSNILVTNGSAAAAVPMFFRVVSMPLDFNDGLVLYLPLDGNTQDASGNGLNGINTGVTLTADKDGNADRAYLFNSFNKVGPEIYVPDANVLDMTNITVAFFFRIDQFEAFSYYSVMVSKLISSTDRSFYACVPNDTSGKKLQFMVIGADNTYRVASGNATATEIESGRWYHYAGTYDGSETRVYLDGKLDISKVFTNVVNMKVSSANVRCGAWGYTHSGYKGALDNVAIWNRALSADEIAILYSRGGRPPL
jgi:Concanavalin A-like lectin/glucanases superfamily